MADMFHNVYREIAKIPEVKNAQISNIDCKNNADVISVQVQWQGRDLGRLTKQTSQGHYLISGDNVTSFPSVMTSPEVVLQSLSPSGKITAQIIDNGQDQLVITVGLCGEIQSINLTEKRLHGKVYCDPYISCLEWSSDEKKIAFVAEEKRPINSTFYSSRESEVKGEEHLYTEDWGEQMAGQQQGVIVTVDIASGVVTVFPLPEGLTPGELLWVPSSTHELIGVANVSRPFKIGLAYCSDRESFLFRVDSDGKFDELTARGQHVQHPRFSPDGKNLIYLQSTTYGDRAPTAQLCLMTWHKKQSEVLIDYVRISREISNGRSFKGLCGKTHLPIRCFDSCGKRVVFSAFNLSNYVTYILDIGSLTITEIPFKGSLLAMDVRNDWILVHSTSLTTPGRLFLAKLPSAEKKPLTKLVNVIEEPLTQFIPVTPKFTCNDVQEDWTDLWEFESPIRDLSGNDLRLSCLYFGPRCSYEGSKKRPLICWPHGGPHSLIANVFSHSMAFFVRLGYSIEFPNYRGSIGHGGDIFTSSLGQCGVADIEDCYQAITECLQRFKDVLDPNQLFLIGSSHGGFLSTHLTSKYPDAFKAVAAINPAVDIYIMAAVSDIPEWAFLEYGLPFSLGRSFDLEAVTRMFERSSIHCVNRVKTPTLFLLGKNDVRVPPSQGINYYKMLLARNIPTKMYMYDDDHPLKKISSESNYVVQIAKWFKQYS